MNSVFYTELGGAMQLMGILRLLLDPENMLATANVSYSLIVRSLQRFFFDSSVDKVMSV